MQVDPGRAKFHPMTRAQALAIITAKLASLDDERVMTVAEIVRSIDAGHELPRQLTDHELTLIQQAKEDFKAGRSCSLDEARVATDRILAKRGVAPSRT
jgi:hypothetical protein